MMDTFGTDNNCGFNIANFKPKFIENNYPEVVSDYERSFIGAFSQELMREITADCPLEVYFTLCKFVGNCGYSLTQN